MDAFRDGHHEFENGHLHGFEGADPYDLFNLWTEEAVANEEMEPNAFVLSTVSANGQPSSRIVYLKDNIDGKLVLYTNYSSLKGEEIDGNSKVSMLFFWPKSARQIRIEGKCSKVPAEISDAYFASRPRGSQIGAWASNQSDVLSDREELEKRVEEYEAKFPNEVPRPEDWGGYWIEPSKFEFWQGRPSRLHDRIVFRATDSDWEIERLNP
ncbi:MAG: pyridoxamine 5'-phosphate oxidase [bacterium]|nr:pyridoxamine 5'-phosphate oxidase [bacterium]